MANSKNKNSFNWWLSDYSQLLVELPVDVIGTIMRSVFHLQQGVKCMDEIISEYDDGFNKKLVKMLLNGLAGSEPLLAVGESSASVGPLFAGSEPLLAVGESSASVGPLFAGSEPLLAVGESSASVGPLFAAGGEVAAKSRSTLSKEQAVPVSEPKITFLFSQQLEEYLANNPDIPVPKTGKEWRYLENKALRANKTKYGDFVEMPAVWYKKLCDDYGQEFANRCIEKLDNYIGSSGKYKGGKMEKQSYNCHYYAIKNWVVEEVQTEIDKKNELKVLSDNKFRLGRSYSAESSDKTITRSDIEELANIF